MKKELFISISVLFLGFCHKFTPVPEITPALVERKIELKGEKEISDRLVPYRSSIMFIKSKNTIARFNSQTDQSDSLFKLNDDVENDFIIQNHRLYLKKISTQETIVFNLAKNAVEKTLKTDAKTKICGIGSDLMILQKENQLVLFRHKMDKIAQTIDCADEAVLNCIFQEKIVYILSSKKLYWYTQNNDKVNFHSLENEAVSGFLLWDDHIYYGSKNRELVKWSLKGKKTCWKVKLTMNLSQKPERIGRFIVITPEDNSIYFYNKNASLYWWEKLNGTRLSPPIIMRENVAVVLLNKKIRFFNFKKKTVQDYNPKSPVLSNPVYIHDYLYFLSHISRKKDKSVPVIKKIGNQYHIAIKIDPEFLKPLGQSIHFNLTAINLIKPEIDIQITDILQKNVFSKTFHKNEVLSFVWLPEKEGKYKLVMEINALNKKNLKIEKGFNIIDLEKIIKKFYEKSLEQCPYDSLE